MSLLMQLMLYLTRENLIVLRRFCFLATAFLLPCAALAEEGGAEFFTEPAARAAGDRLVTPVNQIITPAGRQVVPSKTAAAGTGSQSQWQNPCHFWQDTRFGGD